MIVYTDLHNRSKIYNIPKKYIEQLSKLGIYITTKYSKDVEIYWGDLLTKKDIDNLPIREPISPNPTIKHFDLVRFLIELKYKSKLFLVNFCLCLN